MTNTDIASCLQEQARLLRQRSDNLYRVKAYRQAAAAVLRLEEPIEVLVHDRGPLALEQLPGIGKRLATKIARYLETGQWESSPN